MQSALSARLPPVDSHRDDLREQPAPRVHSCAFACVDCSCGRCALPVVSYDWDGCIFPRCTITLGMCWITEQVIYGPVCCLLGAISVLVLAACTVAFWPFYFVFRVLGGQSEDCDWLAGAETFDVDPNDPAAAHRHCCMRLDDVHPEETEAPAADPVLAPMRLASSPCSGSAQAASSGEGAAPFPELYGVGIVL